MKDTTRWTIVLVAASLFAAPPGWTNDEAPETGDRIETAVEASRQQAREAQEAAVREASEALEAANRLDLDIRLIGPTSVKIAGKG
ncbi:MAG: hypothetical protein OEM63_03575 [Gammaproteobacteria bacterium]|nr:hypothetical protein [Gammaproteobacteria bacterium]